MATALNDSNDFTGSDPGPLRRVLRALSFPYRFLIVALTLAIYFCMSPFGYVLFAVILALPARDVDRRTRRLQAIVRFAFATMHDWLNLTRVIRFDWRAARAALNIPDGPVVLVANHPTLTDTSAFTAAVEELCVIARPDIYRRALIQPLLRGLAYIPGPGRDPASVGRLVDAALDRLSRGHRILFFPEGTRSPEGGLHPFGRAPFEIACRARVPLISVAVHCEPRWLSKGRGFFRLPPTAPRMRLTPLDVFDPRIAPLDSRELRIKVEASHREALAFIAHQTPSEPKET